MKKSIPKARAQPRDRQDAGRHPTGACHRGGDQLHGVTQMASGCSSAVHADSLALNLQIK